MHSLMHILHTPDQLSEIRLAKHAGNVWFWVTDMEICACLQIAFVMHCSDG